MRDTGVGMAPETQARLFEPFMQADTSLDRSKGGLGLGLALVHGLVELHGGGVRAHNDGLGKGTTVEVKLPLVTSGGGGRWPTAHGRRLWLHLFAVILCWRLFGKQVPGVLEHASHLAGHAMHPERDACNGNKGEERDPHLSGSVPLDGSVWAAAV